VLALIRDIYNIMRYIIPNLDHFNFNTHLLRFKGAVLVLFLEFITSGSFAQQQPGQLAKNTANEAIMPLSPNAAALTAYAQLPINKYTGLPSISVPIYTFKAGEIELPISLSYHSGGFKPSAEASWVGLGWSLNAGGMISKAIRGGDDLPLIGGSPSYIVTGPLLTKYHNQWYGIMFNLNSHVEYTQDMLDYQNQLKENRDMQPDVYYYNFSGFSGKFYVEKHADLTQNFVATVADQNNLKIELDFQNKTWTITDGKGIKYYFATREVSSTYSETRSTKRTDDFDFADNPIPCEDIMNIGAWYLDKIEAPNGDVVTFLYTVAGQCKGVKSQPSMSHKRIQMVSGSANFTHWGSGVNDYLTYSRTLTQEVVLSTIQSKYGSVNFGLEPRTDIEGYDGYVPSLLKSMSVTSNSQIPLKYVEFDYSYFNPEGDYKTKRLKLKGVAIQDEKYYFAYNESVKLPEKNTLGVDHWGFYNGELSNTTPIPKHEPGNLSIDYAYGSDRNARPQYTAAGILKEIKYPTGTLAKLEYEPNLATNGLPRVSYLTIEGGGEASKPVAPGVTDYDYFDFEVLPEDPMMGIPSARTNTTLVASATSNVSNGGFYSGASAANPLPSKDEYFGLLMSIDESKIADKNYTSLMEYLDNDGDSESGFAILRRFTYYGLKYPGDYGYLASDYPTLSSVEELKLPPGKYRVVAGAYPYFDVSVSVTHHRPLEIAAGSNEFPAAGVRIKEIRNMNSNNILESYRKYSYNNGLLMAKPLYKKGERIISLRYFDDESDAREIDAYYDVFNSSGYNPMDASAQGSFVGYGEVTEIYNENGLNGKTVSTYKNMLLDYSHAMPGLPPEDNITNGKLISETVFNEAGEKIRSIENFYEIDVSKHKDIWGVAYHTYPFLETGAELNFSYFFYVYKVVSDWCKITSSISTEYTPEGSVVNKTLYTYNPNNKLTAQEIRVLNDSEKLITRYKYPTDYTGTAGSIFSSMVSANIVDKPVEVQSWRQKGAEQYLLGSSVTDYKLYHNKFISPSKTYSLKSSKPLVTAVVGETLETNNGFSNLLFNPVMFDQNSEFEYNANGKVIQVTSVAGIKTSYIWGYSNALPVAEIANTAHTELQGILADLTIQNPPDDATLRTELNKLRQSFPNRMITTYTHNPFVGITSQTDTKGLTTFYEYDQYQRLKTVKDQDGNIVKSYDYHYKDFVPIAEWVNVGSPYCVQDGNVYTGEQHQVQKDVNTLSPTYNQTQIISLGNTAPCSTAPRWEDDGYTECVMVNGSYTGDQRKRQRDNNPYSATMNQTRMVSSGIAAPCVAKMADWQFVNEKECVIVNGQYTGEQLQRQQDMNPQSPTYNQTRMASIGTTGQCTNLTVYAVIQHESQSYEPYNSAYNDYYGEYYYADVIVKFYSDAALNTPLTIGNNITLNIIKTYTETLDGDPSPNVQTTSYTVNAPAGSSEVSLGRHMLYHQYHWATYDDDYEYWFYNEYTNDFTLGSSSQYVAP
jgi:YD repeat-containing protein